MMFNINAILNDNPLDNEIQESHFVAGPIGLDTLPKVEFILKDLHPFLDFRKPNYRLNLRKADLGYEFMSPNSRPDFWVTKYIHNDKANTFTCALSDGSTQVMFRDGTSLGLLHDKITMHYFDKKYMKSVTTLKLSPRHLKWKKKVLLDTKNLLDARISNAEPLVVSCISENFPRLDYWFRTNANTFGMFLQDGTVQFDFFDDTKVILNVEMNSVMFLDSAKEMRIYDFRTIQRHGCSHALLSKFITIKELVTKIYNEERFLYEWETAWIDR